MSRAAVIPYGWKFWRGIYFCGLAVLREIRQYFHPPNCSQYDVIITDTLLCGIINMGPTSFKLRKNGSKIVQIWSTISWFQCGSICCGSNGSRSVYTTNRSGLLHLPPFCYEYNYGKAYPTAKEKSAKCHYLSNPLDTLPAKFSGHMVRQKFHYSWRNEAKWDVKVERKINDTDNLKWHRQCCATPAPLCRWRNALSEVELLN